MDYDGASVKETSPHTVKSYILKTFLICCIWIQYNITVFVNYIFLIQYIQLTIDNKISGSQSIFSKNKNISLISGKLECDESYS